ncbi:MAG: DegT/DnrJ/EryC1/StrS family aminotransferase [Clostridium sp.]|nr:DegT/DnrJ/EryC1/StrS family aminotransferase [Clostridium sp.]
MLESFLDLAAVNAPFMEDIKRAMERVVDSGRYVGGPEVEAFEAELSAIAETPYVVGVSNGLDALRLILRAYMELGRLRPGDEVIVPANTYIATALAVTDNGLRPVFADVSPVTFNLDAEKLEEAMTPRTRAIMPVHLYGRVCWDEALVDFARRHDLIVVEDNAQAIGASASAEGLFGTHAAGGLGHAGGFSFYPTKNIGAMGDAGAVATHDKKLAETVRALANYGSDRRYHNVYEGFNCRLDPVQAAVLRVKLPHLAEINARRRELAGIYDAEICNPLVKKPEMPKAGEEHVWHQYVARVENRDAFRAFLGERGIATDVNYPVNPAHQPCYAAEYGMAATPAADELAEQVVSLPLNTALNPSQISRVAAAANLWNGR